MLRRESPRFGAPEFPRAAFNCSFNIILRHIGRFGFFNRQTQLKIHRRIVAASGGDSDRFGKLSKKIAPAFIRRAFLMLNLRPLAVTRHKGNPKLFTFHHNRF